MRTISTKTDLPLAGHITFLAPNVRRENYENAAWFRDHQIQPGTYPVYSLGKGSYGAPCYCVDLATVVVAADLSPMFGGVRTGPSDQEEIGKASYLYLTTGYHDFPSQERTPFDWLNGATFQAVAA